MEDIIKSVTQAEEKAAEIRERAEAEAAAILADAEKQAEQIIKDSEEKLKLYREEAIATAHADAQRSYSDAVEKSAASAKEYADKLIKDTERQVTETVRRISGGNS